MRGRTVKKVAILDRRGVAAGVLQARALPATEPERGEGRVRMTLDPVNPSDLLVVRGEYGKLPPLRATPGFEGAGVEDGSGGGLVALVRGLKPGRRVAV